MISRLASGAENSNNCVEKGRRRNGLDEYILKSILLGLFQYILAAIGGHHHEMGEIESSGSARMLLLVSIPSSPGICQSTKMIS